MIYVTRKEHFNAAHKLFNSSWSKEKNEEVFGPCANENWHGHNYELFVTIKGEVEEGTGYVVDLKELSALIKKNVIARVDHKNLNMDVPFMKGKLASTENFAMAIWNELKGPIAELNPNAALHSIKLYETERNFVEYLGE